MPESGVIRTDLIDSLIFSIADFFGHKKKTIQSIQSTSDSGANYYDFCLLGFFFPFDFFNLLNFLDKFILHAPQVSLSLSAPPPVCVCVYVGGGGWMGAWCFI